MSKIIDKIYLSDIIDDERRCKRMYKVKEYREKKKWSQELLAKKSGVSRATIASLEAPDSEITTTTSTLIKIATALECRVSDIFLN